MPDLGLLLAGLAILWIGTELALDGAVALTERLGVSQAFVGLTVLAVGTGLPELWVGIHGGLRQLQGVPASGVVLGNAAGSAIAQGTLVLGLAGLTVRLGSRLRVAGRDGVALLLAVALLALLAADGGVTRGEGTVLVGAYALYAAILVRREGSARRLRAHRGRSTARAAVRALTGLAAVVLAAHLVVDRAVLLAAAWGVGQTTIGVFLVGVGTSLPELSLAVAAAWRGRLELSVGNVIGSNTFDLLVPVGVSAALHPLAVGGDTLGVDLPFVALATGAALLLFARRAGLGRAPAALLVGLYAAYAAARLVVEAAGGGAA